MSVIGAATMVSVVGTSTSDVVSSTFGVSLVCSDVVDSQEATQNPKAKAKADSFNSFIGLF
ncbi:MAG TPA: hypothetical protein VKY44_03705 [Flavobacterium sp.]|nr:hypothetical protein [Flavobacterium sp.]